MVRGWGKALYGQIGRDVKTMNKEYRLTKYACYAMSGSMAIVSAVSPLLFLTFRELYGISYTLLGFLVVVNFCTQLSVDLIFTFFSRYFNLAFIIKAMPVLAVVGLWVYALLPMAFPEQAYLYICIGTVIFSGAAGLAEVLCSPIVAAIPADNTEREMSKLHSSYAWGLVAVVCAGSAILSLIGDKNWFYMPIIFSVCPLITSVMFFCARLPHMALGTVEKGEGKAKSSGLFLFVILIFVAGAAECTMTQWASSYAESALKLPKVVGDILGMAAFGLLLAIGRTMHAKKGKNTFNVMLIGLIGSFFTYAVSALSPNPYVGITACMLTGYFTAMLWPGSLIIMEEHFGAVGVTAYAMMAAGGDLGVSVAPQLVGVIADKISISMKGIELSKSLGITSEELGMRTGILSGSLFCLLGIVIMLMMRNKKINK